MSNNNSEELLQIGARIAEERVRLGFSQIALAELLIKTNRTQSKYEAGETMPDAVYLLKFGQLGADVAYIVMGDNTSSAMTQDEKDLIKAYRQLNQPAQSGVRALFHGLGLIDEA